MKKVKRGKMHHIDRRDLIKILKVYGYSYVRTRGDHEMYRNGNKLIPIPLRMDKWLVLRILKQCNISLEEVYTCI